MDGCDSYSVGQMYFSSFSGKSKSVAILQYYIKICLL